MGSGASATQAAGATAPPAGASPGGADAVLAVDVAEVRAQPPEATKEAAQQGLAQRRAFKELQVRKPQPPTLPGSCASDEEPLGLSRHGPNDCVAGDAASRQRKKITRDRAVLQRYRLGLEVMPSANPHMQVRFASRNVDGLEVVVKVRSKRGSFGDAEEERVWRQITEVMLNLPDCPTRAKILEVCEDACRYYIIMERVGGQDLCYMLESSGSLPLSQSRDILRQTLEAVAELHTRGLIHKDLKLENVMIDLPSPSRSGTPIQFVSTASTYASSDPEASPKLKLIDFDTVEPYSAKQARKSKSVIGTDQYIAQEAYGGKYSPASDMFAVGVMAYRMLTGSFPFRSDMFDDEAGENFVGSPKMSEIQHRLRSFKVDYDNPVFAEDPAAREFCESLLAVEEHSRPSALEALKHAFLSPPSATQPKTTNGWMPWRR